MKKTPEEIEQLAQSVVKQATSISCIYDHIDVSDFYHAVEALRDQQAEIKKLQQSGGELLQRSSEILADMETRMKCILEEAQGGLHNLETLGEKK